MIREERQWLPFLNVTANGAPSFTSMACASHARSPLRDRPASGQRPANKRYVPSTCAPADRTSPPSARSFLRLSKLESEAEIVRRATDLSELAGVYFLVRNERVVYVGKSLNVYQRVASHRPSKLFDKVSFIRCHEPDLLRLEAMYISKFNPEFNQAGRTDRVPDQLDEPTHWRHL
jgi:hypothetical protein